MIAPFLVARLLKALTLVGAVRAAAQTVMPYQRGCFQKQAPALSLALVPLAAGHHLEGLSREELDAYRAQQLKAAGVSQPLFDDTARQALFQATKGPKEPLDSGLYSRV